MVWSMARPYACRPARRRAWPPTSLPAARAQRPRKAPPMKRAPTRRAASIMANRRLIATALAGLLSACSLAPKMKTPEVATAPAYKEVGPWTVAQPADQLPRDSWWTLYEATELDSLQHRLIEGNPTLASALANYA